MIVIPLIAGCYIASIRSFLYGIWPFFLVGLIFDTMQYVAPWVHSFNPPHVEGPYWLELKLFGIKNDDDTVITPSEYFKSNYIVALDLPCAFAYFFFMYETLLMTVYLFANDKLNLRRFAWTFFITNMLGITTFYFYPAAPPWYAIEYGMGPAKLDIPSSPARLSAVDAYLGISYF